MNGVAKENAADAISALVDTFETWTRPETLRHLVVVLLEVAIVSLAAVGIAQAILLTLRRLGRRSVERQKKAAEAEDALSDAERNSGTRDRVIVQPASAHLSGQVGVAFSICAVAVFNRLLLPIVLEPPPNEQVLTFLTVSALVLFGLLLLRTGRALRHWLDERFDISHSDNLRARRMRTQIAFIEHIFDLLVIVVSTAVILAQFESGRKLSTGILASAGVASLVVGLAAQRTLSNLLAGFQIAFTSPIRIDDAVVVEDEWGWVEEINLTYVVIRIWDRRRLVLPITYFVEKPFQNWTRRSGQILGSVFLEVAYHTPFEPLNQELNRLLDENPLWDGDARVLQVVEMKERTMQLRALMTATNSPDCWDLRCAIRRGLIEFLTKNHPDCLPSMRLSVVDAGGQAMLQPGLQQVKASSA